MQTFHTVLKSDIFNNYPPTHEQALLGLGCFWGAERLFWQEKGVYTTSVGYAGGQRQNPSYEQVCTGATGHAEVVHIVFDPQILSYENLLHLFFDNHDPTQSNRQGNDVGTQYRSVIFTYSSAQEETAKALATRYNDAYLARNLNSLTTQIAPVIAYYPAEDYHQQYLDKNPGGYCGLKGTGIYCAP